MTVEEIARRVEKEGGTFRALLLGVVESRPFQMRRGGEAGSRSGSGRPLIPPTPPPDKRRPAKRVAPKEPVPAENVFPPEDPKPKETKP